MEEELQSLTDQLDGLISQMAENGERPEGVYSAVEQFRLAMREGSENIRDAVEDIGGDAEVSSVEDGIEEQADRILPDEEFSPEQVLAQELAIEEGLEVEDTLGEEAVESVENSLETEAAEIGEGFQQISEDADTLNDVFNALTESSAISNEALQGLQPTFEGLQSEVEQTIQEVEQGAATLSEGQDQIAKISEQAQEALQENIEGQFENVEGVEQELQQIVSKFFENAQDQMEASTRRAGGGMGIQAVAGVGGGLAEMSEVNWGNIKEAINRATKPVTRQGDEGLAEEATTAFAGAEGPFNRIKNAASAIYESLSLSRVALAGLLAPLTFAVDLLEDSYNAAREFRKETGIGAERMRELREVTASTSAELAGFGLSPDDTADIFSGLQEQFGSLRSAVQLTGAETEEQLVKQVGALSQGFAMSASEAAKLRGTLTEIQMTTGASASRLATATKEIARQNDVAPKAAMQDIAENSEKLAKFASGSADRLASAAVEAQRLGTSLESVTSFQEQALSDLTGQVQKLQEASMLTGQQFNSQALISASFEGTEATVDEIGEQLEGIDVSSLNYFQKESLSDAFGMSVSEIEQISQGRKALQDLNTTAERSKALSEGDVTFQQAVTADDVDEVKNLTKTFNQLYFVMAEELFPVITDLTQAVLPALTATLKFARPLLEGFAEGVRLILSPLQLLTGDFKGFNETIKSIVSPFETLIGLFQEGKQKGNALAAAGKVLATTLATYFGVSYLAGAIGGISTLSLTTAGLGTTIAGVATTLGAFASTLATVVAPIAAIGAAIGAVVYAFYNWEETVSFLSNTFDAFMNQLFGVSDASSWVSEKVAKLGSWFTKVQNKVSSFISESEIMQDIIWAVGKTFSFLGDVIGGVVGYIPGLISQFYEGKTAAQALGSTIGFVFEIIYDPLVDFISLIGEAVELVWNLGTAFSEGASWGEIGSILLDGLGDVGMALVDFIIPLNLEEIIGNRMYNLAMEISSWLPSSPAEKGPLSNLGEVAAGFIDTIFPDNLLGWASDKMQALSETIRSYLPFSPAEEGPLTDIDMVGEALIDTIFGDGVFSFAAEKMRQLGSTVMDTLSSMGEGVMNFLGFGGEEDEKGSEPASASEMMLESAAITIQNATISGISGGEEQAAEVDVQSPNVATVDSDVATGPQRAAATSAPTQQPQQGQSETNEIRLDSSEDNIKKILRQILNTQKKFLKQLQNGNIAVYLDGRKVNKEIVRNTGFAN